RMSIAKNTRRRKKVAPQKEKLSPKSKKTPPRFQAQFVEKYPDMGVVHEGEIRQLVSTVPLAHLSDYGARFQAVMEALEAARQQPGEQNRRADANGCTTTVALPLDDIGIRLNLVQGSVSSPAASPISRVACEVQT